MVNVDASLPIACSHLFPTYSSCQVQPFPINLIKIQSKPLGPKISTHNIMLDKSFVKTNALQSDLKLRGYLQLMVICSINHVKLISLMGNPIDRMTSLGREKI